MTQTKITVAVELEWKNVLHNAAKFEFDHNSVPPSDNNINSPLLSLPLGFLNPSSRHHNQPRYPPTQPL